MCAGWQESAQDGRNECRVAGTGPGADPGFWKEEAWDRILGSGGGGAW